MPSRAPRTVTRTRGGSARAAQGIFFWVGRHGMQRVRTRATFAAPAPSTGSTRHALMACARVACAQLNMAQQLECSTARGSTAARDLRAHGNYAAHAHAWYTRRPSPRAAASCAIDYIAACADGVRSVACAIAGHRRALSRARSPPSPPATAARRRRRRHASRAAANVTDASTAHARAAQLALGASRLSLAVCQPLPRARPARPRDDSFLGCLSRM